MVVGAVVVGVVVETTAGLAVAETVDDAEPAPEFKLWAAALRVMAGAGMLGAEVGREPPVRAPGIVAGGAGADGAAGRGEWPRTMAETAGWAPPPEPPRGAIAAPPPGRLAGFQGVVMPEDELG